MSLAAMAGVWKQSAAKDAAEMLVLLALADWADEYGYCHPSYEGIAKKARVSERHVKRVIGKFVDLGELEKKVRGHVVSTPGHRPGKTGLQARNHYRLTCVPDERRGDTVAPLRSVKEVTPDPERGDVASPEEVTPCPAHIRNSPSEDPSGDPSGRTPSIEAYVDVWNGTMAETPIPQCRSLTPKRRQKLRAIQLEHPPLQWAMLCTRIAASRFCRGENDRGWTATLDWLVRGPDPAVRVLEGLYDDRRTRRVNPAPTTEFTCPHDPPCTARHSCHTKTQIAAARAS